MIIFAALQNRAMPRAPEGPSGDNVLLQDIQLLLMQKQQAMVVNPSDQASSKQIDILHQVNKKTCFPLYVCYLPLKKNEGTPKIKKKNPPKETKTIESAVAKIRYQWINIADIASPLRSAFAKSRDGWLIPIQWPNAHSSFFI